MRFSVISAAEEVTSIFLQCPPHLLLHPRFVTTAGKPEVFAVGPFQASAGNAGERDVFFINLVDASASKALVACSYVTAMCFLRLLGKNRSLEREAWLISVW